MQTDMAELLRAFGRIEEAIEGLKDDIADGKESRSRIHTKLERIEGDVEIVGKAVAQTRDKVDAVERLVTDDVKPVTDEIRRMKLMGAGALVLLGFVFTLLGISLATIGSGVLKAIGSVLPH